MEQEKPRARRRTQHHSTPAADERFRVVVDEGDRPSKNPVSPGEFSVAEPYVGASTTRANDVGPPTMPSNALPASGPLSAPLSVEPTHLATPNEAVLVKTSAPSKGRGWLLLLLIPVVLIGAGLFVMMLAPSASTDTPAQPPVTAATNAAPLPDPPPPAPVKTAESAQDPAQQDIEPKDAAPEPSGSGRKRPRKPTTTQPPAGSTTSPKGGPRSPVIF